jgi:hypothetical protein
MSFIQKLFTSRDNQTSNVDAETGNLSTTYVGQQDRIWWNPDTNAFYYSNGNTPGGIPIGTASGTGIPLGPLNSVQLNNGGGNFAGSSNLVFSNNVLNVVGNISATGNIQGNVFLGNGSQLTGVITSLPNTFGTVNSNGTSLVADSSSGTLNITSGNNLVITSNAGTDTMTVAVADAPTFSGNVTSGNIIANAIVNNGSGNIYHTGNLLPSANVYNLGLPTVPWANAYFGPLSITILDETANIANSVVIENIAANIVIGTTGFTINRFGTTDPIFRIEALTGQLFSNAQTIIANAVNSSNTSSGSLQTAGGAAIAKDLYVGGNIYGTGAQLSNVVNRITTGVGLTQTASTGNVGLDATGVLTVVGTANQINVTNSGQNLTLSLPQGINTNSTVTFANLTITGNLTVNGTTTTANAEAINGKILYLANTSTSNTQIDGGGIILGNATSSYKRSILYSLTNDWWDTDGAGFNTLALTALNANVANLRSTGTAHFGTAYEGYDYPNAEIQIDANVNSYSQIISTNHSPGTNASSDYVAVNNIGDDSNNYIDFGINSNTYSNSDYAVTQANDGYMYVNGGDLALGTQTAGKVINLFTGGTNNVNNIRAVVSDGSLTMNNANVLVQDGSNNDVIELRTDGNIVFNGSQTLRVNSGFYVSSVNTNSGDANIVNYVGGQFVYGPALKDYAGNLKANIFSATGNITGGNIRTAGIVSATGNITGNYFIGNGSQLTGLPVTYGNANVVANLAALGSNPVSTTGNVIAGYILGNGSQLTGVIHTLGNAFTTISSNGTSITANSSTSTATLTPGNNITVVGNASTNITVFSVVDAPVFTGNVTGGNIRTTGLISATGNITGNYHIGNGSQLTGITGSQLTGVITTITPNALSSTVHVAAVTTGNTANIITDATTANTANTIVVRDANGAINVSGWTVGTHLTAVNYTATNSDYWIGTTAKTRTITLPNAANGASTGRQYQIADAVHSGNPGTIIDAQSPATVVGNQPSQQGQIIIATYVGTTWYLN